jgi:hypothetical protein
MTLCKFFAQGFCRSGDSCNFIHEPGTSTGQHLAPVAPVLLTTENLNLNPAAVTYRNEEAKPAQNCRFFLQGKCSIFTFRPHCPRNKSIQMQYSWTLLNYHQTLVQRFLAGSSRDPEVVKTVLAHTCTLRVNLMRRRAAVKIWGQMKKRQALAS